jgi:aspartyl protease family protein
LGSGGFFFWYSLGLSKNYSEVYSRLGIVHLPKSIEELERIQVRLEQLKREPCFRDAVADLSDQLREAGYPRESAISLINFTKFCPGTEFLLANAYSPLVEIGDLQGALNVSDQLVRSYPINSQYRYWRGRAHDQLNDYAAALNDYLNALQLEAEPADIVGDVFYNTSRMYAALQRYCDAVTPMETYISFDPANRRNPQTVKIISDYATKGRCDTHYARGQGRIPLTGSDKVHTLQVAVNGVPGNFVLDTGASFVSVTRRFGEKAKLSVEPGNQILMKTVSGTSQAEIGYAARVSVGPAEAQGVVIAVVAEDNAFGDHLDGLLGMSFLARFVVTVSPTGIDLKSISIR